MRGSVAQQVAVRQEKPASFADDAEGRDLSLIRECLRRAIDESRWKKDALASAIGVTNGAYLSQMLSGEKPINVKHLRALPDDVEGLFAKFYAESFGHIVTAPVYGREAVERLVSGLLGVLSPQLPAKFGAPLKARLKADDEQE